MIEHYAIDVFSLSAEQRNWAKEGLEQDSESDLPVDWARTEEGHPALDVMWESKKPIKSSKYFPHGCPCIRLE